MDRALEWALTIVMLGFPPVIYIWPSSISLSAFHHLLDLGVTVYSLGTVFLVAGIVRLVSLILNGPHTPWTAYGRIFGSFIAGVLWLEMSVSLVEVSLYSPAPQPTAWAWFVWAICEAFNCYRAAGDAVARS